MLLCKMCIEKKLPPYKYNNNDFELKFCEECQCETQYLDYELFKNKLFDVISTNYKFLSDLPYRAGWFYEVHDEDGVNDYYNFIESLDLGEVLTEKLAEDWGEKFGDELLVLYDDSLEEYEGCNKEFEWEGIQESFKHEFRFFNTKLKDFLDHTFEYLLDNQNINQSLLNNIQANTILYRGRSFDSLKDLMKEVNEDNLAIEVEIENEIIAKNIRDKFGLVPSFLASDQRMTPFGISALYLSTEKMACVAEIRALVGQYVGIAEFSNRIELKLLNLNKLAEGLYPHHLDEDYLGKLDVYIFFKKLIASVSKPKLESGKFDYLISQYFFEYLRVKFGDQIQGIFLKSVQLPTADNIILFLEVTDEGIDSSFLAGNNKIYFSWNKESRLGLSISQVKSIAITTEIEYISHPRMKESTDWI
ncbi:MAG TPA: RES domain-containing protein [Acinetobacter johnsonii]|uniref:RES domain-containing protein n=1 Tax=Acinetobacter johnsonii TaxID=40214 RepID=UPI00241F6D6F|nr:RES domain-containing protein [Lactococcus sp.]HRB84056.1 RES domain-containing protein [Acinetobacter johnsonii]